MSKARKCIALISLIFLELVASQEGNFFLKASKSVPRIGRRSKSNSGNTNDDNFEKFFLKASKSVPRIGRRGSPDPPQNPMNARYLRWSDLADLYEYNPELFASPQLLSQLEDYGMLGDDPFVNINDWDKIRMKRTNLSPNYDYGEKNKEITEFRLQPQVQ